MAFLGMSEDFDLDDDGILRDSASSAGGFLLDNDGIIRDDLDLFKNTGHWTDSGFGGDKQSSTSTLQHFHASFDDDSHLYDVDQSVNISELEASKDDLSFERASVTSLDQVQSRGNTPGIISNRSSLEKPPGFRGHGNSNANKTDFDKNEEFTEEYYEQLRELGVLVDSGDLGNTKDSLQDFEQLESNYSGGNPLDETGQTDTIVDFFRKEAERQEQEQQGYKSDRRPNSATSNQTVSSQSFPEVSPEEALLLFNTRENAGTRSYDINGVHRSAGFYQDGNTSVGNRSFENVLGNRSYEKLSGNRSYENALVNQSFENRLGNQSYENIDRNRSYENRAGNQSYEFEGIQRSIDSTGLFHQDGDTSGIFHRSGDDDEIFLITSRMGVRGQDESASATPAPYSPHSSRPTSRGSVFSSRAQTPYREGWTQNSDAQQSRYRRTPSPEKSPVKAEEQKPLTTRATSATPNQSKSRPSSVASHRSTVSEAPNSRPNTARSDSSRQLPKARSEESLFERNKTPRSSNEKMPKRLLPKVSPEETQNFKTKSKSTTNISNRPGPVKPTHMSMSDITRLEDGVEGEGDRSHGELSVKLKQEHQKRKQATELVQQLQKDYDSLLSKYALAELTIDQMRLGAKIRLHADSPTPNQIQTGTLSAAQHPQVIQMGSRGQGVVTNSPVTGVVGHFSPQPDSLTLRDGRTPITSPQIPDSRVGGRELGVGGRTDRGVGEGSRRASISDSEGRGISAQNVGAEQVKTGLLQQALGLNQRIESFNSLLEQRQLTLEEQEEVFENIRTDHEKLRRHYLQAKEDYNVLRRSGASLKDANFDQGKELEGELFRLGMKFDEIHASVDTNLKEKSATRQPFQSNRLTDPMDESDVDEHAIDQLKQKMHGTLAGSDIVPPKEDVEFEQKLQRLHDEYNALMDRYRRLKQMAKTPERDKEIDNLVRKLKQICDEAPDMFRLAPELEERWQQLQRNDSRGGSRGQTPQPESAPPGMYFLSENEPGRAQRQGHTQGRRTPDYRSDDSSRYRSDREMGSRSGLDVAGRSKYENMNGNHDNLARKDQGSDRGRYSPSPRDRRSPNQDGRSRSPRDGYSPVIKGPQPGSRRAGLNISRERLSSDGRESSRGRDSPNLSLPRPRRHEHDFRDPKSKKQLDMGSRVSLDDSGLISDQDQGALANLPGPGKFKQMTKQRGADDVDSGFIGSVVGSDVGRLGARQSPSLQQQQQQQQQALRLRNPQGARGDNQSGNNRAENGTSTRRDSDSSRGQPRSRPQRESESEQRDSSMVNDSMDVTGSFMDDFTETEVSESDRGHRSNQVKGQGHSNRRTQGHSQTLEGYTEEEDTDATPKASTKIKLSQKSEPKVAPSPTKPQRKSRTVVSEEEEEEITPRASPSMRSVSSRYASSSEMDTPRNIKTRPPQAAPPRSGSTRAPSGDQVDHIEGQITQGRETILKKTQQMRESRAVGSDREWDRGHESDATRVSNASSSRLRALQEEVEKLKQRVEQTVENPPQAPVPPQPQRDQPEYYDPFDDPYGFMRMPRRRANSFSGANAREWDEWYWTLPNQRQHDGADIPLGYAAADAYADVPQSASQETSARNRLRRRRMERMKKTGQGNVQTEGQTESQGTTGVPPTGFPGPAGLPPSGLAGPVPGAHPGAHPPGSPQAVPGAQAGFAYPGGRPPVSPGSQIFQRGAPQHFQGVGHSRARPQEGPPREGEGPGLYEYYVPSRYSTQAMRQQLSNRGYFQTPSGAKIYANQQPGGQAPQYLPPGPHSYNQPHYAFRRHSSQGYQSDTGAMHQGAGAKSPFYTIRRSSNRQFTMPRHRQMAAHYDDLDSLDGRSGYQTDPGMWSRAQPRRVRSYAVETTTCPLCGGSGEHTHAEFEDGGDGMQYGSHDVYIERSARPKRRSRSFSSSRSRYHSPERSSYWVREFRATSSEDSEEEHYRRRRSRSMSRSRRKARKYHRMRGYHSDRDADFDDSTEIDLNESLNLTEDISRLTKRMMKSVRGELRDSKRREYGSSYW